MDINKADYEIIDSKFGKVIYIKFTVYKIIQNENFILYEGMSSEKKKKDFILLNIIRMDIMVNCLNLN